MPDAARRATLRALGVTDGQLRASAYRSPFRGVHADASIPPSVERRIRDVVPLLPPGAAVGGWPPPGGTAPRPRRVGRVGELPVLVCVPRTRSVRPRPGLRVLRSDLATEEVTVVRGVPVTSPVRTAVDLARLSGQPRRGVIAVDALWARAPPPDPPPRAPRRRRLRGRSERPRAPAELAAPVSAPRTETELRMIWTLDAGLPRPLVNERVVDEEGTAPGPRRPAGRGGGSGRRVRRARPPRVGGGDGGQRAPGGTGTSRLVIAGSPRSTPVPPPAPHVHRLQDAHRRGLATTGPRRWHVARV